jgi:hypothetical protein
MSKEPQPVGEAYRKVTVVAGRWWVPVVAPIGCDYFGLMNVGTGPMLIRTPGVSKEDYSALLPGVQDSVTVPFAGPGLRFSAGEVVFFVRSADRTSQTITITWVR